MGKGEGGPGGSGATENKGLSPGVGPRFHLERRAERSAGALEREENNGRSAERETKIDWSTDTPEPLPYIPMSTNSYSFMHL